MGTAATVAQSFIGFGDNALVSAYLEGNEDAFEALVHRYQDRLVNYLNNLLHDYELAVDLAQEAFIRVFKNAHRYKGKYQFSTWVYRIATNLAIDEIRRRERKGRFFFYNVMSLFQKELSYVETATILQISLGTAKSRIHRAKLLLREKLSGCL